MSCRALTRAAGCAGVAVGQAVLGTERATKVRVLLWLAGWWVAIEYFSQGAPYFLCSVLFGMLANLGDREEGQMSAYSVFNENYTRLLGETDPDRLAREMAGGGMAMMLEVEA